MSESKKFTFRKVTESERALLLPPANSSTNLLLETPLPPYPECLQAIVDETEFSDDTVNLISGNFPEHEGEEDISPCVLRKTDLRTTFARESSSNRTQFFETPTANANGQSEHVLQLNTP